MQTCVDNDQSTKMVRDWVKEMHAVFIILKLLSVGRMTYGDSVIS